MQWQINHATVCDLLTNMAKMKFAMNRKHGTQNGNGIGFGEIRFGHEHSQRTSGYFNAAAVGQNGKRETDNGKNEKYA